MGLMQFKQLIRFKGVLGVVVVIVFSFLVLSILFNEVKKSQDIRSRASGSSVAGTVFCEGKKLCPDTRCVGETWRECLPCPSGTARAVYKVTCGENEYSECTLDDQICNDK